MLGQMPAHNQAQEKAALHEHFPGCTVVTQLWQHECSVAPVHPAAEDEGLLPQGSASCLLVKLSFPSNNSKEEELGKITQHVLIIPPLKT